MTPRRFPSGMPHGMDTPELPNIPEGSSWEGVTGHRKFDVNLKIAADPQCRAPLLIDVAKNSQSRQWSASMTWASLPFSTGNSGGIGVEAVVQDRVAFFDALSDNIIRIIDDPGRWGCEDELVCNFLRGCVLHRLTRRLIEQ
jgi:hypothetical protein